MSTSWNLTKNKIIKLAFRQLGVLEAGDTPNPEMEDEALDILHSILYVLSPKLKSPFKMQGSQIILTPSSEVTISGVIYRCINKHTAALLNKPDTGAEWELYWVEGGSTGGTWTLGSAYTCINEITFPSSVSDIVDTFIRSDNIEIPVKINNLTYLNNISDISAEGTPSTIIIDNKNPITGKIFPIPEDSTDILYYNAILDFSDMDLGNSNIELKKRWNLYIVLKLALYLANSYLTPPDRIVLIKGMADEIYKELKPKESVTTMNRVSPAF